VTGSYVRLYFQNFTDPLQNGGRRGMRIGYWWGKPMERDHWEDQGVGGWTILKWILER
jgi:hypothetical protein